MTSEMIERYIRYQEKEGTGRQLTLFEEIRLKANSQEASPLAVRSITKERTWPFCLMGLLAMLLLLYLKRDLAPNASIITP